MIMFGNYYFTNYTMHLITLLKSKNISTNITYLLIKTNVKFSSERKLWGHFLIYLVLSITNFIHYLA